MRTLYRTAVVTLIVLMGGIGAASAGIEVVIDKSDQVMHVYEDGEKLYTWDVSTGRKDSWTPKGTFGVQSLSKNHRSSIYDGAPMPYSIFFNGNIAIHGTTEVSKLGERASHGCVRLLTANAKKLFGLAQQYPLTIVVRA